jgi:large subunit ribosomal protein L17
MRHGVDGRQFGRNTPHRKAMLRNLANALIEKEVITTTVPKAKEARRVVERLITLAKKNAPHAQRLVFDRTRSKEVVSKLFEKLASRYKDRQGGYTRILKLTQTRRGDGAQMALFTLVGHPEDIVTSRRKKKVEETPEEAQKEEGKKS